MKKISDETKQYIIELFQTGKYKKIEIAKQCNCSTDTVNRVLQKNGLMTINFSPKIQAIENNIIEDFMKNKLYCKDIAKKYKIDEHTIYRILDKHGIKRQTGYHSNCIEDYFENIDTPDKAYILGFLTADGAVVNDVLSIEVKNFFSTS